MILDIKKKYPNVKIIIRPHPLMFDNFIKKGLLSAAERDAYRKRALEAGIAFDTNANILDTLKETKILISDYSSIILDFFIANIPIIYCNSSNIELNDIYNEILETEYIVNSSDELDDVLFSLMNNDDYKSNERRKVIDKIATIYSNSSKKIIEELIDDFLGKPLHNCRFREEK